MLDENKEILTRFGLILRQLRNKKGLTLLELEVRTGINEGDISKIENGKKNLAFTTLIKLARGLDISPAELLADLKG